VPGMKCNVTNARHLRVRRGVVRGRATRGHGPQSTFLKNFKRINTENVQKTMHFSRNL